MYQDYPNQGTVEGLEHVLIPATAVSDPQRYAVFGNPTDLTLTCTLHHECGARIAGGTAEIGVLHDGTPTIVSNGGNTVGRRVKRSVVVEQDGEQRVVTVQEFQPDPRRVIKVTMPPRSWIKIPVEFARGIHDVRNGVIVGGGLPQVRRLDVDGMTPAIVNALKPKPERPISDAEQVLVRDTALAVEALAAATDEAGNVHGTSVAQVEELVGTAARVTAELRADAADGRVAERVRRKKEKHS